MPLLVATPRTTPNIGPPRKHTSPRLRHRRHAGALTTMWRLIAVTLAALVAVTLLPQAAQAVPSDGSRQAPNPRTSEQARDQIGQQREKLEVVTEEYNTARVKLQERKKEERAARAELAAANAKLRKLQAKVKAIAVTSYTTGGQLTSFSAMVSGGSPEDFIDRLSTLDLISSRQKDVLEQQRTERQRATEAEAEAEAAVTAARKLRADLAEKKKWIESNLGTLREKLAKLTAKEKAEEERRRALAAQRAREAAERAARAAADRAADEAAAAETAAEAPATVAEPETAEPEATPENTTPETSTPAPPVESTSSAAATAVQTAIAQVGKAYVWAAAGPDAFDCSGLTMYAWGAAGVALPHSSSMQMSSGTPVSRDQLLPGDLVFYYSPVHHVAIYVGNGQVVHASTEGVPVGYASVDGAGPYAGATRVG